MVEQRRSPAEDSAGANNREPSSNEQEDGAFWRDIPGADVRVFTSEGKGIPAHSSVLASTSPVLESLIHRRTPKRGTDDVDKKSRPAASIVVPILGVPHRAVISFIGCLYDYAGFSRCPLIMDAPAAAAASLTSETTAKEATKWGVHLLVLSHAFQIPWLKRATASALATSLTPDNVIDMLQLARQCDAPGLQVRCMTLIRRDFKEVQRTEGWRFMQSNDPWLELEVLERVDEEEKSDRRRRKGRRVISVYAELGEAMECLHHICYQGCDLVGPKCQQLHRGIKDHSFSSSSCEWSQMCRGLQQLMLHFATCEWRKRLGAAGGCGRCRRMWQLLRLHSVVCDRTTADSCCNVPFCRQFKEKADGNKDRDRWNLLAAKVGSSKVIFNVSKRKRDQPQPRERNESETTAVPS